MAFSTPPKGRLTELNPFSLHVSHSDLEDFHSLLSLSKIGPETWYNKHTDGRFGVSREWLVEAKAKWLELDWRKQEERINSYPNFTTIVNDDECGEINVHLTALFSEKSDAVPIIFLHGWPGSFLEFLPMLEILRNKYNVDTLPYHVIVPSLPGYGLSSTPAGMELTVQHAARILNQLMVDLGFGSGYVAQGGDIGSFLARQMCGSFEECVGMHLNTPPPPSHNDKVTQNTENLSAEDLRHLGRMKDLFTTGSSYVLQQGFRPSTTGLALSSSPLALLPWIGEKFIDWADPRYPLSLETILTMTSLYWFTSTLPRSLYPYRPIAESFAGSGVVPVPVAQEKPSGYSVFPYEIIVLPKPWAAVLLPNLIMYKTHAKGGHFAALEQPEALLEDVEVFIGKVRDRGDW